MGRKKGDKITAGTPQAVLSRISDVLRRKGEIRKGKTQIINNEE